MWNTLWCFYLLYKIKTPIPIHKNLQKRFLKPVRIKLGRLTTGMLIASYSSEEPNLVFIEAIWYRKGIFMAIKRDLFRILFNTFFLTYTNTFKVNDIVKITIVIKLDPHIEVEDLYALDLHGFHPDPSATIDILDFSKPWREREDLKYLVYSRGVV